jgi:hypothetical protein
VIVASITPVSTFAVRMRARATDGLINRGPQMKTVATRAADRTTPITRRINRFRRNVTSISRSIIGLSSLIYPDIDFARLRVEEQTIGQS